MKIIKETYKEGDLKIIAEHDLRVGVQEAINKQLASFKDHRNKEEQK